MHTAHGHSRPHCSFYKHKLIFSYYVPLELITIMLNIDTSAYLSPNTQIPFSLLNVQFTDTVLYPKSTVSLMTHTFLGLTSWDVQECS